MITITAGHSNTDSGAVAFGRREADIAAEFRNLVAYYLRVEGIPFKTDGEGKVNKSLSEAIKMVSGSKVAVEFHCNAFTNPSAGGVEALAQTKDKTISKALCKAVSDVMGIAVRGSDGGWKSEGSGQHSRLGYVRAGGIILELFFITNPKELEIYDAKKWVIAKAVAQELIKYVK